jgi:hypothetical protein
MARAALRYGTARPSAFEIRLAYLCIRQYTRSARRQADETPYYNPHHALSAETLRA